jgi:hypothetical protein
MDKNRDIPVEVNEELIEEADNQNRLEETLNASGLN